MKYPLSIPSTPVKRRHVAACEVSLAASLISKKIDEGSFYNIYLTKEKTVLRIAKRRESGELEASILGMVASSHVNRMIYWWCEDGFSHFEMEYCSGGNLAKQLEEYRSGACGSLCARGAAGSGVCAKGADRDASVCKNSTGSSAAGNACINNSVYKNSDILEKGRGEAPSNADSMRTTGASTHAGAEPGSSCVGKAGRQAAIKSMKLHNNSNSSDNSNSSAVGLRHVLSSKPSTAQPPDRSLDSFNDIDNTLEQNTSSIYIDNESESSDLSFTPDAIDAPAWAIRMMAQVSQALSAIHKAGVVHMDVKPDNILRCGADYKLCDFNISRVGEGTVDRDGDFVYMAPEVLKNRCYYASDVYSLGMIYLELCNPSEPLPHEGEAHRRIRRNDFGGWRVDGIGRMMLEKNPAKRCSAEHVSRYFEELQQD